MSTCSVLLVDSDIWAGMDDREVFMAEMKKRVLVSTMVSRLVSGLEIDIGPTI